MSVRFISALSLLLAGCGSEDSPYVEVRFPTGKQISVPPPMESISPDKLLPRVVHRSYFDAAAIAEVDNEPDRFGIVRPLGNDLFAFVAHVDDDMIRNVHTEHLQDHNLTVDAAWETATANLRRIAFDGATIQQTITSQ